MNKSRLTTRGKLLVNRGGELLIEEAKVMLQGPSIKKRKENFNYLGKGLANRKAVALKILDKGNVIDRYLSIKAVINF